MPPQTSGKKQKTSQRHLGSCEAAFGWKPLPFQPAWVDPCPVVCLPRAGSLSEVSGRAEFPQNSSTEWLLRPGFTSSAQSCACHTGLVLPTAPESSMCSAQTLEGIRSEAEEHLSLLGVSYCHGASLRAVVLLQQSRT